MSHWTYLSIAYSSGVFQGSIFLATLRRYLSVRGWARRKHWRWKVAAGVMSADWVWPLVIAGSGQLSLRSAKQKILDGNKQSTLALTQSHGKNCGSKELLACLGRGNMLLLSEKGWFSCAKQLGSVASDASCGSNALAGLPWPPFVWLAQGSPGWVACGPLYAGGENSSSWAWLAPASPVPAFDWEVPGVWICELKLLGCVQFFMLVSPVEGA